LWFLIGMKCRCSVRCCTSGREVVYIGWKVVFWASFISWGQGFIELLLSLALCLHKDLQESNH
jgi:hypothetical protein